MVALFGAPTAHEGDAERAVRAALDIRAALAEFGAKEGVQLAVHQGISTGRVLAGSVGGGGRHDYSVVGDAVNVAASLRDRSVPGEILIGPDTYALVGSLFETEDVGTVGLRGRTGPLQIYRVDGEASTTAKEAFARLQAPLVGRESELRVLYEALGRLSQGEGGVVYIAGDAGVGKTRLIEEGRRRAGPATWLAGHATSMGPTASYQPIRQMLQADVGWAPNDDREERMEKLARRLDSVLPDDPQHPSRFLAALLGIQSAEDAEWLTALEEPVLRQRLHGAVGRYVAQLARQQPLVLVFEDLHWVDAATAALIEELTPLVHEVPLLLCLISRPDLEGSSFRPERISPRAKERFRWLRLGPLSRRESRELVAKLLGSTDLPPGLNQLVETRAEGNPFFVQEVLRSLIDSACIARDDQDVWRLTGRSDLAVPDTLQGMIASRVDRLLQEARDVIRLASIIGRSFSQSLVSCVAGSAESDTARQLRYLEDVEMIRTVARGPEPQFTFTHALVQEAVYETIPLRDRRLLHERVAQTIESVHAEAGDESDLLAYHYSKAERWDRAQYYLFKAGENAGALGVRDTSEYYRQAFEALLHGWSPSQGDELGADLEWFLAALVPLHNQQRLAQICEPLQEFHARVTETFGASDRRTLAAAEMLGCSYGEKSMWPEAIAILESTLWIRQRADGPGDPSLARLLGELAACLVATPRREEAEALLARGIDLQRASATTDHETLARLYATLSYYYASKGEFLKVKTLLDDALTVPGLDVTSAYSGLLVNLCDCETRLGLAAEAELHGRLVGQTGVTYLRAFGQANLGFSLRTFGRYREAQTEYEQALEVFDGFAREWEFAWALAGIAECQLQAGELDAAAESAGRAATVAERAMESEYSGSALSEALWTLAGVELARGNLPEAERLLEDAASSAPAELVADDPLWEAELLFRRGQLRLRQGRRDEAERDTSRAAELLAGLGGENHPRRKTMLAEWERLAAEC